MLIHTIKVGYLQTNCYVLSINDNCLIIDPGDEANKLIKYINDNNLNLLGVLITHSHPDHIGALNDILNYKSVDVYKYNNLKENDYNIGPFNYKVIYTLGHTNDSISFYFEKDKKIFSGDFIFLQSIGRTDLPTGDYKEMNSSIEKIKKYNDDITIYPGHGDKTNLGFEKKHNQFFN